MQNHTANTITHDPQGSSIWSHLHNLFLWIHMITVVRNFPVHWATTNQQYDSRNRRFNNVNTKAARKHYLQSHQPPNLTMYFSTPILILSSNPAHIFDHKSGQFLSFPTKFHPFTSDTSKSFSERTNRLVCILEVLGPILGSQNRRMSFHFRRENVGFVDQLITAIDNLNSQHSP